MRLRILLDQKIPGLVGNSVRELRPEWEVMHVDEVGLHGQQTA